MNIKVIVNVDQDLDEDDITFNVKEMTSELESLITVVKESLTEKVKVYHGSTIVFLDISSIVSFTIVNKKVNVNTINSEVYTYKNPLKEIDENTSYSSLLRISQSTIINTNHVKCFKTDFGGMLKVEFKNNHHEYISRRYVKKVRKYFEV